MQLVKVLQTTMLPGMSGLGAKSETDPVCAKLVTAEIRSVDGSPLFSSVFLNGTPAKRNEWDRENRCEVVSCTDLARCQRGHGPEATRPAEGSR